MPTGGGTSIGNALTDALFGTRQAGEGVGKWLLGVQSRNDQGTQARCAGVRGALVSGGRLRAQEPAQPAHPSCALPCVAGPTRRGHRCSCRGRSPCASSPRHTLVSPAHTRGAASPHLHAGELAYVWCSPIPTPTPHTYTHAPLLPTPLAANERTFLAWLSMATTLGTVGTAIAGLAEDGTGKHQGPISQVGAEGGCATASWGRSA